MSMITNLNTDELMMDSGAASLVCPIWFASTTQAFDIAEHERPSLRTEAEDPIELNGYKWFYMTDGSNQQVVIPFYVCSISQPILSVTRLTEQGFAIHLSEQPTLTHPNGFQAKLRAKEGTYFLPVNNTGTPPNYKPDAHGAQQGIRETISPITLTPRGAQWVTHQHDIWACNSQGYLVRLHKAKRRAIYIPDQQCPVPMDKLQDYRRMIAHKHDGTTEDFEEKLHSLEHSQQKRMLNTAGRGETWFKVKEDARPPKPPTATPTTSNKASPEPNQQQQEQAQQRRRYTQKRWQQALSNNQAVNSNHTQQQEFHGQRNFQQRKTIGSVKEICGQALYIRQQTQDGPDVTKLIPEWIAIVKPTSGARWYGIDDDWAAKRQATANVPWTGSARQTLRRAPHTKMRY